MLNRFRDFKDMVLKNKGLSIVAALGIIFVLTIIVKMFIDLLPFIALGLGALIIYKLYKRGFLG
jgi:hypothetical protein